MMASYDWRVRHAGLMAVAAIGEATGEVYNRFFFFGVQDLERAQLPSIYIPLW